MSWSMRVSGGTGVTAGEGTHEEPAGHEVAQGVLINAEVALANKPESVGVHRAVSEASIVG